MDEGPNKGQGSSFNLNTQSFPNAENLLLIQILKIKLNLNCSLHKNRDKYKTYIKSLKESMPKFKQLVLPYFHESIKYKLD
jgi:DNA-binding transcriptional regulator WhiA